MFKRRKRRRQRGSKRTTFGCFTIILAACGIGFLAVWGASLPDTPTPTAAPATETAPPTLTPLPTSTPVPTVTPAPTQPQASAPRPVPGAADVCYTDFDWSICEGLAVPRNCDAVRQMGIQGRTAACCFPDRDGDGDGYACE